MTQRAIVGFEGRNGFQHAKVKGRELWALDQLRRAGARGCSTIDSPAPRWSGYIHNLRKAGIQIQTIYEAHGGEFPGTHARYILNSLVLFLWLVDGKG